MIVNIVKQKMPSFLRNAEIRHSWVKDQLSRLDEGLSILDAGAGECRYKEHCRHLKYTSQDFGKYWYDQVSTDNGLEIESYVQNGNYFDTVLQELMRIPIMLKSHTSLGIFSYSLYLAILPLAGLIYLLSKLSHNSEYYSTFGYMLTIKKG